MLEVEVREEHGVDGGRLDFKLEPSLTVCSECPTDKNDEVIVLDMLIHQDVLSMMKLLRDAGHTFTAQVTMRLECTYEDKVEFEDCEGFTQKVADIYSVLSFLYHSLPFVWECCHESYTEDQKALIKADKMRMKKIDTVTVHFKYV